MFAAGVKLDFRHLPDGHVVTAEEVEAELARIEHTLQPLDIVLINTRAGALFGQPGYLDAGIGMGREATMYLLERGVRVVGTDAWSWDAPFKYTRERFAASGDASIIWEGHKAGRDIGYGQMENWPTSNPCQRAASRCRAFPTRSAMRPQVLCARWLFSKSDRAV